MYPSETNRRRKIRILLVDDHPIVRSGVRRVLSTRRDIVVVGEAGSGKEALAAVEALKPDIILLDVSMGKMSGIEVAKRLRRKAPEVKVLVFTMHLEKEYVLEFAKIGIRGYMLKDASRDELVRAIQTVNAGERYFSEQVSKVLVGQYLHGFHHDRHERPSDLTEREYDIIVLIAEGSSNKEIATRLKLSFRTIESHRERIMKKLDIHTAIGLTKFAIKKGMIKVQA